MKSYKLEILVETKTENIKYESNIMNKDKFESYSGIINGKINDLDKITIIDEYDNFISINPEKIISIRIVID